MAASTKSKTLASNEFYRSPAKVAGAARSDDEAKAMHGTSTLSSMSDERQDYDQPELQAL